MTEIINSGINFDYVITLTGQDYPIKSEKYIQKFLEQKPGSIYTNHFELPNQVWKNGGIERVMSYHYNVFKGRFFIKLFHKIMIWLIPLLPIKTMGVNHKLFGGEAHFAFSFESIKYITEFLNENKKYLSFFRHTYMPDEVIFQTILMNSYLKDKVTNNSLKYIDWSRPKRGLPAILRVDDFGNLVKSDALFARKFDVKIDGKILDLLDSLIIKND